MANTAIHNRARERLSIFALATAVLVAAVGSAFAFGRLIGRMPV